MAELPTGGTFLFIETMEGAAIPGTALDEGLVGGFEVFGYNFAASATADADPDADRIIEFQDLQLSFSRGLLDSRILALFAEGTALQISIRTYGADENGEGMVMFDLVLDDAFIRTLTDSDEPLQYLSLSYERFTLTSTDSAGLQSTFGYDKQLDQQIGTPLAGVEPTNATKALDDADHWYLRIDGVDGGVRAAGYRGAFEIVDFSFGGETFNPDSAPRLNPLGFDFEQGGAADELLKLLANGRRFDAAQLLGVAGNGAEADTIYDLRLNGVRLADLQSHANGADHANLKFDRFSLTTSNGVDPAETHGYDVTRNLFTDEKLDAARPVIDTALSGEPDQWFVKFDLMNGGVLNKRYAGAFELDDLNYNLVGKLNGPRHDGMTLDFDAGAFTKDFFRLLAANEAIGRIEIFGSGLDNDGKRITLTDIQLGGSLLESYTLHGGKLSLNLDYKAISITTALATGTESFGINAAGKQIDKPLFDGVKIADAGRSGSLNGLDYFLIIDGVNGGQTDNRHLGWFDLDDFDFSAFRQGNTLTFNDLSLLLDIGSAEGDLLRALAGGTALSMRIVGERTANEVTSTVYDLRLGDAIIHSLHESEMGQDDMSIAFDRYSLGIRNRDGKILTSGYDLTTGLISNKTLTAAQAETQGDATDGAPGDLFVLHYGDIKGYGQMDVIGSGFDVGNADFSMARFDGITEVSDFSLTADLGTALPFFFENALIGEGTLAKLTSASTANEGVDILRGFALEEVLITGLSIDSSGHNAMTFNVARFGIQTELVPDEAFGFDRETGTVATVDVSAPNGTPGDGFGLSGLSDYYLTISGFDGGVADGDHDHAFAIESFSLNITREVTLDNGSRESSSPMVSALSIEFEAGSSAADFLRLLGNNATIAAAQIIGDGPSDNTSDVFDLLLNDVEISGFNSSSDGDTLVLEFHRMRLATHFTDAGGDLTTHQVGWNLDTQETDDGDFVLPVL